MKNGGNSSNVKVPNKSGAYIKATDQQKDSTSPKVTKGGDLRAGNSSK